MEDISLSICAIYFLQNMAIMKTAKGQDIFISTLYGMHYKKIMCPMFFSLRYNQIFAFLKYNRKQSF